MAWYRASLALIALCLPVTAHASADYLAPSADNYPESTSVVQRAFDATMKAASTTAGAPNGTTRGMDAPRLKIAPNAIDRAATKTLDYVDDIGGVRQAYITEQNGLPRRPLLTLPEKLRAKNMKPIVIKAAEKKALIAKPMTTTSPISIMPEKNYSFSNSAELEMDTPVISAAPTASITEQKNPIIISTKKMAPSQEMVDQPHVTPSKRRPGFLYREIDQSKTLTTPELGQITLSK